MRVVRSLTTVLVVGSMFVACGGDDDSDVDATDLDGRSFVATEITGHEIVAGSEIVVSFADGTVSVQAGCNTQNGGYDVNDGVLEVEMLMSTMMACDDALTTQDQVVADLVTSAPSIELDGDELVIASGETSMTLTSA